MTGQAAGTPSAALSTTVHSSVIYAADGEAYVGKLVMESGRERNLTRWDAEIIRRALSHWFRHLDHLYAGADVHTEAFSEPAEWLHEFLGEELYRSWISRADTDDGGTTADDGGTTVDDGPS